MTSNDTIDSSFRVDLRLITELGERLISRDEVAVVELVKNAYDADASDVIISIQSDFISVEDDGEGMDISRINEGWFTLGTSIKKQETKSKKGRRILGEKGLGRLALFRLGGLITIFTKRENKECYKIVMDWAGSKKKLNANQFTPLSEMKLSLESINDYIFPKNKGTKIIIENLNVDWKESNIDKLKVNLSRLLDPVSKKMDKFDIILLTGEKQVDIEPPGIINKPHYFMNVELDENGYYQGTLKWYEDNIEKTEKIKKAHVGVIELSALESYNWSKKERIGCGPFKFQVSLWNLDSEDLTGNRLVLRQWSGFSLFRDGFRIVQPDVDWLGLDLRRVQNPTLRVSTNQIIGGIFIGSDQNPNLIDKTDREGLIENKAFTILLHITYILLNILERKRYQLRRKKRVTKKDVLFRVNPRQLTLIADNVEGPEKEQIIEVASELEAQKEDLNEWMIGRDRLSSIGLLVTKLLHSARQELAKIADNYPLVESYIPTLTKPLDNRIRRMIAGGKQLAIVFNKYDPFLQFTSMKRDYNDLRDIISSIQFIFAPSLIKEGIFIDSRIEKKTIIKINPTDFYVIFSNLIDNSFYWLSNSDVKKHIIELRLVDDFTYLILEVADSGPGVDPSDYEFIFDPGFSTKPNGSGLGLSIVKNHLDQYKGTIEVSQDKKLNGALFTIRIPLEVLK